MGKTFKDNGIVINDIHEFGLTINCWYQYGGEPGSVMLHFRAIPLTDLTNTEIPNKIVFGGYTYLRAERKKNSVTYLITNDSYKNIPKEGDIINA